MEINELEQRILKIEERNRRVELDKAWETSITRKVAICILTYIVVILFSIFINRDGNILLNSLVPVIGFFLSTQSLVIIRNIWVKKNSK